MKPGQDPVRLSPRGTGLWSAVVLVSASVLFLFREVTSEGVMLWAARATFVALVLILLAHRSALLRPRRWREPEVTPAGSRVFVAPRATVLPLLGAWGAVLLAGTLSLYDVVVGDGDARRLNTWSMVGLALVSVPHLVLLLTGRLHPWQVEVGRDHLTYQGLQTRETWPWSSVLEARLHPSRAGIALDIDGARKQRVIPLAPLDVPPQQLLQEIQLAAALARG